MEILKTFIVTVKGKKRLLYLVEGDTFIIIHDEEVMGMTYQSVVVLDNVEAHDMINETRLENNLKELLLSEILTV
jgi:hypothetical protein